MARRRLRLCRGGPFEQVASTHHHSPERAQGRIGEQEGLCRKLAELPGGRGQRPDQFPAADVEEVAPGDPAAGGNQAGQ